MENWLDLSENFWRARSESIRHFSFFGRDPELSRRGSKNSHKEESRSVRMLYIFHPKTWVWPNFVPSKWSPLVLIFLYVEKSLCWLRLSLRVFAQNLTIEFFKNRATRKGKSEHGEKFIGLHFLEKFDQSNNVMDRPKME